jgi:hypothetical protein
MDLAEIAVTEFAAGVLDNIAKLRKMNGMTIAAFVPGLVHTHPPCDFPVETCAYCIRHGNIFADEQCTTKDTTDIIGKYRSKIMSIFEDMEKEIIDIIHTTAFPCDDENDLEKMLMDAMDM